MYHQSAPHPGELENQKLMGGQGYLYCTCTGDVDPKNNGEGYTGGGTLTVLYSTQLYIVHVHVGNVYTYMCEECTSTRAYTCAYNEETPHLL